MIPMRICMLIYHYWPGPEGGTERQCRKLAINLSGYGLVCTILTAKSFATTPKSEKDQATFIVRLPTVSGMYLLPQKNTAASSSFPSQGRKRVQFVGNMTKLMNAVVKWLNALLFQLSAFCYLVRQRKQFDLIHVHTSEWIAGFAAWMGRLLGKPVVCKTATLPSLPPLKNHDPFPRAWDQQRRRAFFIALNEDIAEDLKRQGIGRCNIRVIPNGVSLPDLSSRSEQPMRALFVGNLTQSKEKAFDVLFEAWSFVEKNLPDAHLIVLGAGDPTPWKEFLENMACGSSVFFEGFRADVDAYYREAALLVLPSKQEGMSNALLEAQSWGIPAVVSDIPGNRSVVDNGVNGFVVPVNEARELAQRIVQLLSDRELRINMGKAARERVERHFSIEAVTKEYLKTYADLLHLPMAAPRA